MCDAERYRKSLLVVAIRPVHLPFMETGLTIEIQLMIILIMSSLDNVL